MRLCSKLHSALIILSAQWLRLRPHQQAQHQLRNEDVMDDLPEPRHLPPVNLAADEKRIIQRHQLHYYLQVYNQVTDKPIGYIVNISTHGMMLVSRTQLLAHAVFGLQIRLPVPINGKKKIDFEALSHWCKPDVEPGCYDTGFSFTQPNEELQSLVTALAEYFSFNNLSVH